MTSKSHFDNFFSNTNHKSIHKMGFLQTHIKNAQTLSAGEFMNANSSDEESDDAMLEDEEPECEPNDDDDDDDDDDELAVWDFHLCNMI